MKPPKDYVLSIVCDERGVIREVLQDSLGLATAAPIGALFPRLVARSNFTAALNFLSELTSLGTVSDRPITFDVAGRILKLNCSGRSTPRGFVINAVNQSVGASDSRDGRTAAVDRRNAESPDNASREESSLQNQDNQLFDEIMRLNNDLISAQRELVRKNSELEVSETTLRLLATKLEKVREEERSKVAREVHDELGQLLTAIKIDIFSLLKTEFNDQQSLVQKGLSVTSLVDKGMKAVQEISARLRPSMLDHLGLTSAIEWLTEDFTRRTGLPCSLDLPTTEVKIDIERSTALFRILQEAMLNIVRHANASLVTIHVEATDDKLVLRVSDNGSGIFMTKVDSPTSLGLLGMRERARQHGGRLELERPVEGGTCVVVTLPLD